MAGSSVTDLQLLGDRVLPSKPHNLKGGKIAAWARIASFLQDLATLLGEGEEGPSQWAAVFTHGGMALGG